MKIKEMTDEDIPYELLLEADPNRALVDEYLRNGKTYLAMEDGEVAGVCVCLKTSGDSLEIMNISVAEDHQRKGYGKRLIEYVVEDLEEDIKYVEIGTGNSSIHQLYLYQKCGFRIVGIDKNFFVNNYDEDLVENGIKCVDMIRLRRGITDSRKVEIPSIYRHFKGRYYATMGMSTPADKLEGEILQAIHTESDSKIDLYESCGNYYHDREIDSENLVIYKTLYDGSGIFARPETMFTSKVDREKYPDVKQKYRFEER